MTANTGTDYYAALGLLPDADIVLIKAAYRALAKKYHPDTAGSGPSDAREKFIKIQEAYEVLGNDEARRRYDESRTTTAFEARDANSVVDLELDKAWDAIIRKHPEIDQIHADFRLMSPALANSFQLLVLEADDDKDYAAIEIRLEARFLRKYFGRYKIIQGLAKRLLLNGKRDAARKLNEEINKAGSLTVQARHDLVERYETTYLDPKKEEPPDTAEDRKEAAQEDKPKPQAASADCKRKTTQGKPPASPPQRRRRPAVVIGVNAALLAGSALFIMYFGLELAPRTQKDLPMSNLQWSDLVSPATNLARKASNATNAAKGPRLHRKQIYDRIVGDETLEPEQLVKTTPPPELPKPTLPTELPQAPRHRTGQRMRPFRNTVARSPIHKGKASIKVINR